MALGSGRSVAGADDDACPATVADADRLAVGAVGGRIEFESGSFGEDLLLRWLVRVLSAEEDLGVEFVVEEESVRKVSGRLHLHGGLKEGADQLAQVDLASGVYRERVCSL